MKEKTIEERVLETLRDGDLMTAAEVHCEMKDVKLSSLSSALCKLANHRRIIRVRGVGPRGGAAYARKKS